MACNIKSPVQRRKDAEMARRRRVAGICEFANPPYSVVDPKVALERVRKNS